MSAVFPSLFLLLTSTFRANNVFTISSLQELTAVFSKKRDLISCMNQEKNAYSITKHKYCIIFIGLAMNIGILR